MAAVKAFAIKAKGSPLEPIEFEPVELVGDQVEIAVKTCGLCHSDLSMIDNNWGFTRYPLVPGHEVVGVVDSVGPEVKNLKVGQTVGLGWYSGSCLSCTQCMSGNHNLCPKAEATIIGRRGGFATRVRCQAAWALPIPEKVNPADAGPLFCGGTTVFNPLVQFGVKPTDRVGVIGIGGLGHMAVQFLNKWGCEVTAFSSSEGKTEEAMKLGAHRVVNSRDPKQLSPLKGTLDFILSTVNVTLNWQAYLECLAPKGRFSTVGVIDQPISLPVFPLLAGQKTVSGSPVGSPSVTNLMLEFCARHKVAPVTEHFPLSKVNDALEHLRAGKARYRIVLDNDL